MLRALIWLSLTVALTPDSAAALVVAPTTALIVCDDTAYGCALAVLAVRFCALRTAAESPAPVRSATTRLVAALPVDVDDSWLAVTDSGALE